MNIKQLFYSIALVGVGFSFPTQLHALDIPQSNTHLLPQNQFNYGDVNLTKGVVQFTETDLHLPGVNGLDLVISRTYNSQHYRSSALQKLTGTKTFGPGFGGGWSLNIIQRAFVVDAADDDEDKIVIEVAGQASSYKFDEGEGVYLSNIPGNENRVLRTDSGVRMMTGSGVIYEFDIPLYTETHKVEGTTRLKVTGYYLSVVNDRFENQVSYTYEQPEETTTDKWESYEDNEDKGIVRVIGKSSYEWLKDRYSGTYEVESEHRKQSIINITDTFGREVALSWEESYLETVTYYNDNGTKNTLRYGYEDNVNGHQGRYLSTVTIEDETGDGKQVQSYEYEDYTRGFFYFIHYEKEWFSWKDHCGVIGYSEDYDNYASGSYNKSVALPLDELDDFNGNVLSKRTHAFGATVEYSYKESFEITGKTSIQSHAIYPVVISKTSRNETFSSAVSEEDQLIETEYIFTYPEYRGRIHNVKASYTPSYMEDQDAKLYYFDKVSVETTVGGVSVVESEHYTFEDGLLVEKAQGDFVSKTEWDIETNLQKEESSYVKEDLRSKVEYSYDENRNLIEKKMYDEESEEAYLVEQTSYYSADDFNDVGDGYDLALMTHYPRYHVVIGENGGSREKTMSYTDRGKVESEESESSYGNQTTRYSYDSRGRVVEKEVTGGADGTLTQTYSYEGDGQDESEEGEEGYVVTRETNGKSSSTVYNGDTGRVMKTEGLNGEVTQFTYDNLGKLLFKTYANGQQTEYKYSEDYKTLTKTEAGRVTVTIKDDYGRVVEVDRPEGELDSGHEYLIGKTIKAVYKRGDGDWELVNQTSYDEYLRKIEIEDMNWGSKVTSYDDENNSVSTIDPLGREQKSIKNNRGQTIQSIAYFSDSNDEQSYAYDEFGGKSQFVDPKGTIYYTDLSESGQVETVYHPTDMGVKKKWKVFDYYANGLTKEVELYDDNGDLSTSYSYDYDNENRITEIKQDGDKKEWLSYDESSHDYGLGRLTTAENDRVKTEYDYDNMGRITQETTTIKSLSKSYSIGTAYTNEGGVSLVTFDDGKSIGYSYDDSKKVTAVSYDTEDIVHYSYDSEDSKLTAMTFGNGSVINYEYDDKDLLVRLIAKSSTGATVYKQSYSYDDEGQIVESEYTHPITGETTKRSYGYTERQELENVYVDEDSNARYRYEYDKLGNMLVFTLPDKNGPVTVQSNVTIKNELEVQLYEDGREVSFEYNAEGHMTNKSKIKDSEIVREDQYSYNYQGQIETITRDDSHLATYYYNHKKERVYSKTTPEDSDSIVTWYYNDGAGHIIGEGNSDHQYSVRYIYSGNEKVAMIRPDQDGEESVYYFINNAQGTPVMIIDGGGEIVSRINLDSWGNPEGFQVTSGAEVNYTGKKYDAVTGLYYFNQRYYDPQLGRFLTHDPAKQYLNPYLYSGNSPLMYVDPNGELAFWIVGMAIGAFLGGNGKDLTKLETWGDIALGAAAGAAAGYGIGKISQALGLGNSFDFDLGRYTGIDGETDMLAGFFRTVTKKESIKTVGMTAASLVGVGGGLSSLGNSGEDYRIPEEDLTMLLADNGDPSYWLDQMNSPGGVSVAENIQSAQENRWNLLWFYNQVRNGGSWDYKQRGPVYEDFGNWHYGVTGRAAGIPRNVLLRAAGWAQGRAGTSRSSYGRWYGAPPYGDDKKDQSWIERGMDYYDSNY